MCSADHGNAFTLCSSCLPDPVVWKSLQLRFSRTTVSGVIQDVYDGRQYKNHAQFLLYPVNVSLILNTDGVAAFKSSMKSFWPVWLAINELSKAERYVCRGLCMLVCINLCIE